MTNQLVPASQGKHWPPDGSVRYFADKESWSDALSGLGISPVPDLRQPSFFF